MMRIREPASPTISYSVCVAEVSSYSGGGGGATPTAPPTRSRPRRHRRLYVALLGRCTAILWSWLTMLLFFLHALYIGYQFTIVAVNITLVSAIFALLYRDDAPNLQGALSHHQLAIGKPASSPT